MITYRITARCVGNVLVQGRLPPNTPEHASFIQRLWITVHAHLISIRTRCTHQVEDMTREDVEMVRTGRVPRRSRSQDYKYGKEQIREIIDRRTTVPTRGRTAQQVRPHGRAQGGEAQSTHTLPGNSGEAGHADVVAELNAMRKRLEFLEYKDGLVTRAVLWCEKECRSQTASSIRLRIPLDTDLAAALSKCQKAHHAKITEQREAEPDPITGIRPNIAGDPRPPMVRAFFKCVMAKYDEWVKNTTQEEQNKHDTSRHEAWVRVMNILNRTPRDDEVAYYSGYAARFEWRPLKDKESGIITILPHLADSMSTMNSLCEVAEFTYGVKREQGTVPRTRDMKELQHMADSQDVWGRTS